MEEEILKAAEELFLEKGFKITSTTEIAQKAGCTQAMVNYYFRTKSNLFEQIFLKKIEMMFSTFISIEGADSPFSEKLRMKMEAQFDFLSEHPRIPLFLINELTYNPNRLKTLRQHIEGRISFVVLNMEKELNEEIEAGRIRPIALSDLLLNVISLNLFLFVSYPIASLLFQNTPHPDSASLLEHRKKENIEVIFRSLRP